MTSQLDEVIDFWFSDHMSKHWFSSTDTIDQLISDKYQDLWLSARNGELQSWLKSARGCLALCIVLDQFPLNMFRGQAKSFSTESMAINISLHAIEHGFDELLPKQQRAFLYMPLMHSENIQHQDLSVKCFEQAGLDDNAKFARHHRDLIRRFGRFPHRNTILGRESSQQELAYLSSPEAFTG